MEFVIIRVQSDLGISEWVRGWTSQAAGDGPLFTTDRRNARPYLRDEAESLEREMRCMCYRDEIVELVPIGTLKVE